ncbi:hypothetical protein IKZ40_05010 [bacterium]|nr:hypothetical protein [bacterium]
MISYFSEEPEYSSWDEYTRKLAEDAVHQVLTRKNPNAKALRTVRRNLGLPNEYLEFKPKEPEQYNLPEFKPSIQTDYFKKENPFNQHPTPSFKNWEEYSKWLLKDLPKPSSIPKNAKPLKWWEINKDYIHQNDYPEIRSSLPKQANAPELIPSFTPKEKRLLWRTWVRYHFARDNFNDRSIRGINEMLYLLRYPYLKMKGAWPPKYDEKNPELIRHKNVNDITIDDYMMEKLNGGDPNRWYAKWSDTDPIYGIKPKTKAGTFVKGYLTRRMNRHLPSDLIMDLLPMKLTILNKLDKIKDPIEQVQDLIGAYDDVKKFDQDQK